MELVVMIMTRVPGGILAKPITCPSAMRSILVSFTRVPWLITSALMQGDIANATRRIFFTKQRFMVGGIELVEPHDFRKSRRNPFFKPIKGCG